MNYSLFCLKYLIIFSDRHESADDAVKLDFSKGGLTRVELQAEKYSIS